MLFNILGLGSSENDENEFPSIFHLTDYIIMDLKHKNNANLGLITCNKILNHLQ